MHVQSTYKFQHLLLMKKG